jgi:hypothetical protein
MNSKRGFCLKCIIFSCICMHACNVITEARVGNSFANYPIHIQILYNALFKTIIYYNFDNNSI